MNPDDIYQHNIKFDIEYLANSMGKSEIWDATLKEYERILNAAPRQSAQIFVEEEPTNVLDEPFELGGAL